MKIPPLPEPRLLARVHVNIETVDHLGYTVESMVEWRRQLVELAAREAGRVKVQEERDAQRLE